jgi:hypothetical protein
MSSFEEKKPRSFKEIVRRSPFSSYKANGSTARVMMAGMS